MLLLLATILFAYQANQALGIKHRPELWLITPWLAISLILLGLQLLGLPLAPLPLSLGLALCAAALKLLNLKTTPSNREMDLDSEESTTQSLRSAAKKHPILASLLAITLALFLLRTSLQPLRGFDIPFRWGALPNLITERQSLDFYPPRRAAPKTSPSTATSTASHPSSPLATPGSTGPLSLSAPSPLPCSATSSSSPRPSASASSSHASAPATAPRPPSSHPSSPSPHPGSSRPSPMARRSAPSPSPSSHSSSSPTKNQD